MLIRTDIGMFCAQINLAACIQLEELSVRFCEPTVRRRLRYAGLARVIADVPQVALRSITLRFNPGFVLKNATPTNNALDTMLARYPTLRDLRIVALYRREEHSPETNDIRASQRAHELEQLRAAWPLTTQRARVTIREEEDGRRVQRARRR